MSGQIYKPTFGNSTSFTTIPGGSLQTNWDKDTKACYAAQAQLNTPAGTPNTIICGVEPLYYHSKDEVITSTGYGDDTETQSVAYSVCCPALKINSTASAPQTMGLLKDDGCPRFVCLTSDETLAKNFSSCISDVQMSAEKRWRADGTVPANATIAVGFGGWCEYIDKKGIKTSGAGMAGVFGVQGALILAFSALAIFGQSL